MGAAATAAGVEQRADHQTCHHAAGDHDADHRLRRHAALAVVAVALLVTLLIALLVAVAGLLAAVRRGAAAGALRVRPAGLLAVRRLDDALPYRLRAGHVVPEEVVVVAVVPGAGLLRLFLLEAAVLPGVLLLAAVRLAAGHRVLGVAAGLLVRLLLVVPLLVVAAGLPLVVLVVLEEGQRLGGLGRVGLGYVRGLRGRRRQRRYGGAAGVGRQHLGGVGDRDGGRRDRPLAEALSRALSGAGDVVWGMPLAEVLPGRRNRLPGGPNGSPPGYGGSICVASAGSGRGAPSGAPLGVAPRGAARAAARARRNWLAGGCCRPEGSTTPRYASGESSPRPLLCIAAHSCLRHLGPCVPMNRRPTLPGPRGP